MKIGRRNNKNKKLQAITWQQRRQRSDNTTFLQENVSRETDEINRRYSSKEFPFALVIHIRYRKAYKTRAIRAGGRSVVGSLNLHPFVPPPIVRHRYPPSFSQCLYNLFLKNSHNWQRRRREMFSRFKRIENTYTEQQTLRIQRLSVSISNKNKRALSNVNLGERKKPFLSPATGRRVWVYKSISN